jgi:hypothetical protein
MTVEPSVAEAEVRIRPPGGGRFWFGLVAVNFALATLYLAEGNRWLGLVWLFAGCGNLSMAFSKRAVGIDLTREHAVVRSPRRRRVPWQDVQAVISDVESNGTSVVRLIVGNNERITLQAPIALWRRGDARFERDFQRIDQWWHEFRGDTWRPMHQEAPGFVG